MNKRMHWFLLRQVPDVLGMLGEQATITVQGMDALVAGPAGMPRAADRLRKSEHEADGRKRELRKALSEAFSTPLEPEDIFELSRGLDEYPQRRQEHRRRGRGDADRSGLRPGTK